jgi:cytochrome c peroxidase
MKPVLNGSAMVHAFVTAAMHKIAIRACAKRFWSRTTYVSTAKAVLQTGLGRFEGRNGALFALGICIVTVVSASSVVVASEHGQTQLAEPIDGSYSPRDAVSPVRDLRGGDQGEAKSHALIELGRILFFDKHLSRDGAVSCAGCHIPEKAYADSKRIAIGVDGSTGTRNVPSLLNVAYQPLFFWDGRRATLEEQALDPFLNPREHGLRDIGDLMERIANSDSYKDIVYEALGVSHAQLQPSQVGAALAAFERTLLAGNSAFDRSYFGHEMNALTPSAQRGMALFVDRAKCVSCHTIDAPSATFSDGKFHGTGIGIKTIEHRLGSLATVAATASDQERARLITTDPDIAALGRFAVSKKLADIGLYRTPSLRNVAITAPYMHDGSVATLDEAIERELYYRSIESARPLVLTKGEKADLLAFLQALTSDDWPLRTPGVGAVKEHK